MAYKHRDNPDILSSSYPRQDVYSDITRTFKDVLGRDVSQADAQWFQGMYEVLTHHNTDQSLQGLREKWIDSIHTFLHDVFAIDMQQYWGMSVLTTEMNTAINNAIDAIKFNGDPTTGDVTHNNILNAIIVDNNTLTNLEQLEIDIQGRYRPLPQSVTNWNKQIVALMIKDHSITVETVRKWLIYNSQTYTPIEHYLRNFQDISGSLSGEQQQLIRNYQNNLLNKTVNNITEIRSQIAHSAETHDKISGYIHNFQGITTALDSGTERWITEIQNELGNGQVDSIYTVRGWIAQSGQTKSLISGYITSLQGIDNLPSSTQDWVQAVQQLMADGKIDNIFTVKSWIAHADQTTNALHNLFWDYAGLVSGPTQDLDWIHSTEDSMTKYNDYDLAKARAGLVDIIYDNGRFNQLIQDTLGREPTYDEIHDENGIEKGWKKNLGSGKATYADARQGLANLAYTSHDYDTIITNVRGYGPTSSDYSITLRDWANHIGDGSSTYAKTLHDYTDFAVDHSVYSDLYLNKLGRLPQLEAGSKESAFVNSFIRDIENGNSTYQKIGQQIVNENSNVIHSLIKSWVNDFQHWGDTLPQQVQQAIHDLQKWLGDDATSTLKDIRHSIAFSSDTASYITDSYYILTNQELQQADLIAYQQALSNGQSMQNVIKSISQSGNAQANIFAYSQASETPPPNLWNAQNSQLSFFNALQQASKNLEQFLVNKFVTPRLLRQDDFYSFLVDDPSRALGRIQLAKTLGQFAGNLWDTLQHLTPEEKIELGSDILQLVLGPFTGPLAPRFEIVGAERLMMHIIKDYLQHEHTSLPKLEERSIYETKHSVNGNGGNFDDFLSNGGKKDFITINSTNNERFPQGYIANLREAIKHIIDHSFNRGHITGKPINPLEEPDKLPLKDVGLGTQEELSNYLNNVLNSIRDGHPLPGIEFYYGPNRMVIWDDNKSIFIGINRTGKFTSSVFRPIDKKDFYLKNVQTMKKFEGLQ